MIVQDTTLASAGVESRGFPKQGYPNVKNTVHLPASARDNMPEHYRNPTPGLTVYISKGSLVGLGGTAYLEKLPSGHMVKTPKPDDWDPSEDRQKRHDMRIEAQIYEKIGLHPRVPRIIEWDSETDSLTMEYMENGDLTEFIRKNVLSGILTSELRLRWAKQAAEGLQVVHAVGAVHCDVSPRNFLLDSNLDLKISDFAGSSLLGSQPSAAAGERFSAPGIDWNKTPVVEDDLFGLGSLIYFIMTDKYPYEVIPSDEVGKRFERHEFPKLSHLSCGPIIKRCWERQMHTAENVLSALDALEWQTPVLMSNRHDSSCLQIERDSDINYRVLLYSVLLLLLLLLD